MNSFATALARHPQTVRRLLAAHVPDHRGRCRGCGSGGSGRPGPRWPCTLRFHAAAADQLMGSTPREDAQGSSIIDEQR